MKRTINLSRSFMISSNTGDKRLFLEGFRNAYVDNKVYVEAERKDGKKHGVETILTDDHEVLLENCYYEGKLHGYSRVYFRGKLLDERHYVDGEPRGPYRHFHLCGNIRTNAYYTNDRYDGKEKCWYEHFYPSGAIQERGYMYEGKKDGTHFEWDEQGKEIRRRYFVYGFEEK
jgi:antitoxin component YwqK of YwqJK toxin-antitoxin module